VASRRAVFAQVRASLCDGCEQVSARRGGSGPVTEPAQLYPRLYLYRLPAGCVQRRGCGSSLSSGQVSQGWT